MGGASGGPGLRAVLLPRTRMRRQWSASPSPGCPSLSAPLSLEPAGLEAEVPAVSFGLRPQASALESSAPPRSPPRPLRDSRREVPRSHSAPPSPMPAATFALATAWPAWAGQACSSPPLSPPAPSPLAPRAPRAPPRPPPAYSSSGPAPARPLHPSLLTGLESGFSDSQRCARELRLGMGVRWPCSPTLV